MAIDFSTFIPAADSWFAKNVDLPKNTSADSAVKSVGEGAMNSSLVIYARASGVTLASGKKITLIVKTSSDESTWKTLHTEEITGAPDGLIMDYVLPPSCQKSVKVSYETDDDAAVGKLDIFIGYIPR